MITLFTAPKSFEGHIGLIQRNAIRSWLALGSDMDVIMIGSEPGMARAAAELGVVHLPDVERTEVGTPRMDSIFRLAQEHSNNSLFCYLNADVMLMSDFSPTVSLVEQQFDRFLIVGQRWDVRVEEELKLAEFKNESPLQQLKSKAELHPPGGSDYFVFRRGQYDRLPAFALGRSGWDNWMIYAARAQGAAVVDATQSITVLHQEHDYNHLPGGQSHYRLPESQRNVELAGGREMMFTLQDATWKVMQGELQPFGLFEAGWWRRLESRIIVRLGPGRPAQMTRMLFHLPETIQYLFGPNEKSLQDVESRAKEHSTRKSTN